MQKQKVEQLQLPFDEPVFAVHCFFHCGHVVRSTDPQEAGRLMERHYEQRHSRQIDRIVQRLS